MIPLIIESSDPQSYLDFLPEPYSANHPDLYLESEVTLPHIKEALRFLRTPPYKARVKTLIFTKAADMTHIAQNTLLKSLEELPDFAQIILIAPNLDSVLPTIQSRCFIHKLPPPDEPKLTNTVTLPLTYSEALRLASKHGTGRDTAKSFLLTHIHKFHRDLYSSPSIILIHRLHSALRALSSLEFNTNPRLALEWYLFNQINTN